VSGRREDPSRSWHRDEMPWWAWVGIVALRVWALLAAVLPLALFLALGWLWLHWRDPAVVAWVRRLRSLLP